MSERSATLDRDDIGNKLQHAKTAAMDCLGRYQAAARIAGSTAVAVVLTLAVIYGPHTMSERQLAATVKMERLAIRLARVKRIPPETASEIARIVDQPEFDCSRVSCRPTLDARNRMARARLLALIGPPATSAVSSVGRGQAASMGNADR